MVTRGAVTMALVAYRTWRRLTPAQRRWAIELTRTHGPTVASRASETARRARMSRTGSPR